jgi:hypothetical protein
MFDKTREIWENYGLEVLAGLSLLVIFILFLYNLFSGQRGSFSSYKHVPSNMNMRVSRNIMPYEYMEHTDKDSKLELKAKFVLESIFKRPFLKIRPQFLRNDVTGQNLEIDLYNDELKLGVEVNGDQHYRFIPYFHRNKEAFRNQRYRDEMKKVKCRDNGITLIEIPYKVGEDGLKPYLVNKLRLEGYLV